KLAFGMTLNSKAIVAAIALGTFSLPSVAQTNDPWEGANTRIYAFNKFLDRWLLRPVAVAYNNVTPDIVRQGVGNFFSNIDDINVLANDVLQLKFRDAASDSGRLLINTTVGL